MCPRLRLRPRQTGASARRLAHVSGFGGSGRMTGQPELAPFGVKLPGNAQADRVAGAIVDVQGPREQIYLRLLRLPGRGFRIYIS